MLPNKDEVYRIFDKYKKRLQKIPKRKLPFKIEVENVEHIDMFARVLVNHPEACLKISCGVNGFFIGRSLEKLGSDTRLTDVCCCYARRMDGSVEHFSMYKCFANAENF